MVFNNEKFRRVEIDVDNLSVSITFHNHFDMAMFVCDLYDEYGDGDD